VSIAEIPGKGVSEIMAGAAGQAPRGQVVSWGIPFDIGRVLFLREAPLTEEITPLRAQWLVFAHTTDVAPLSWNEHGFVSPARGQGRLGEHVADYVIRYADGSEARQRIVRRHQVAMVQREYFEGCLQAVAQAKPRAMLTRNEQPSSRVPWGASQTRVAAADVAPWMNWIWAWENPHPEREIRALRFEPKSGIVVVAAVSAGTASAHPLRWLPRRKALLRLPDGVRFDPNLDERGLLKQLQLDMGQIISARPRQTYPNSEWPKTFHNTVPGLSSSEIHLEYTAHPDALFHLDGGKSVPVVELAAGRSSGPLVPVAPASRRVTLRVVEKGSGKPVPVNPRPWRER
jgi:hypothetical protein